MAGDCQNGGGKYRAKENIAEMAVGTVFAAAILAGDCQNGGGKYRAKENIAEMAVGTVFAAAILAGSKYRAVTKCRKSRQCTIRQ